MESQVLYNLEGLRVTVCMGWILFLISGESGYELDLTDEHDRFP
jgi:hypothetical protein